MIHFVKMQGIGNDFVMVDAIGQTGLPTDWVPVAQELTDRRFGIGGDGLILVERGASAPFRMRMFNPDGSESEMCGNGIRCFGKLIRDLGYSQASEFAVETGAGVLTLTLTADGLVGVDMGPARLKRGEIGMNGNPDETVTELRVTPEYRGTAVSMGNPHLVIFTDTVKSIPLERVGPELERHEWFPHRTNVHFAQVVDRGHIVQRTWERGAGITLACGTGACSVAVAGFVTGRTDRSVRIDLPGGTLQVEYQENGHVRMTGPAATVFHGVWRKNSQ